MADFFAHESAYVDDGCAIGAGTKIWHFTHVMAGATIGRGCNIGQNVVISPGVVIGDRDRLDVDHANRGRVVGRRQRQLGRDLAQHRRDERRLLAQSTLRQRSQ